MLKKELKKAKNNTDLRQHPDQPIPESAKPPSVSGLAAPPPGVKLAYSIKEAAEYLGVSTWYIRSEIERGALLYSRPRGRIMIPYWNLLDYLRDSSQGLP